MQIQPLYRLVYISRATTDITPEVVKNLLVESRMRNEKYRISGLLIYMNHNFLQVLEGPKNDVEQLYNNIVIDPRHTGTEVLEAKTINDRIFSEWKMVFSEVSTREFKNLSGFTELYDLHIRDRKKRGKHLDELIQSFKKIHSHSS